MAKVRKRKRLIRLYADNAGVCLSCVFIGQEFVNKTALPYMFIASSHMRRTSLPHMWRRQ